MNWSEEEDLRIQAQTIAKSFQPEDEEKKKTKILSTSTSKQHSTPSSGRSITPAKTTIVIHERLYEDAVMRQTKLADSDKMEEDKPTKTIKLSEASQLYERLATSHTESSMRKLKLPKSNMNSRRYSTPTNGADKVSIQESYNCEKKVIPLSEAIGVYERGLQSKIILANKVMKEHKIKKWR